MERMRRLETWGRLGYAARGIVYLMLGWIALSSGKALPASATVQAIDDLPGGAPLLAAFIIGLFGYGLYKLYTAALDLDGEGSDAKGTVTRIAYAGAGLAYWTLAILAAVQLFGSEAGASLAGRASGSGGVGQDVAQGVGDVAGGNLLLVVAGLLTLAIAAVQFTIAYKAEFMEKMAGTPRLVRPAGQVGYAARALIIAIVGYFAVKAGIDGDRVRNFGDALAVVRDSHQALFKLIAAGLMLFGLVSLMMARYGRINDDDVVERVKAGAAHPRR